MNARQRRLVESHADKIAQEIGAAIKSVRLKPNARRMAIVANALHVLLGLGQTPDLASLMRALRPELKAAR
jgi:hypothetical protein